MKKLISGLVVLIILGLIGWKVYQNVSKKEDPKRFKRGMKAVPVEIAEITKRTLRDTGLFTGSLESSAIFTVSGKIGGRLEKLHVNIGDRITNGRLIAELDDDEHIQRLQQAEAELSVAKAQVEQAKSGKETAERELERVKKLHERKVASDSELDRVKSQFEAASANYKVSLAEVERREAAKNTAEIQLAYTKVKAEWDILDKDRTKKPEGEGKEYRFIGERFAEEGTILTPNQPIVSIVDISPLIGVIHATDRDYAKMRKGKTVVIYTDAVPGKKFTGTINRIAPLLQENSRQARVEIDIPNRENLLRPGMFIRAEIIYETHENVTAVSRNALARRKEGEGIFLADLAKKTAAFVPLKLGIEEEEYVEVADPPDLSGWVVVLGHHLLKNGSSITLPKSDSEKKENNKETGPDTGKKKENK